MYISLNKLHKSKKIFWIKSFITLREHAKKDVKKDDILEMKVTKASGTKIRYFIPEENIEKYIKAYKAGELF